VSSVWKGGFCLCLSLWDGLPALQHPPSTHRTIGVTDTRRTVDYIPLTRSVSGATVRKGRKVLALASGGVWSNGPGDREVSGSA